jgi:hypothetical protein
VLFRLLNINQLPVVDRTQNLLCIIQSRSERLALFVCYINQLPVVDRTQNLLCIIQRRSERLVLFVCYINQLPGVERTQNILHIIQLPTGANRTQNVLYIIQRRSEQLDVLFRLLYINQLPVVEWSLPKMYYISSNADRSDSRKIY